MMAEEQSRELNLLVLFKHHLVDISKSIYRICLHKISRNSFHVSREYDQGHWRNILGSKKWLNKELREFIIGDNNENRICKIAGKIVCVTSRLYYQYRLRAFQELIAYYTADVDEIVELGSGYGYNLFSLSSDPKWRLLHGFDISPNAIQAGKEIANYYKLDEKVSFDMIDITKIDDSSFKAISNKVVLTYFCLEQLPDSTEIVIHNLLKHKPKRVINIEPASTNFRWYSISDMSSILYLYSMNYQRKLFSNLYKFEELGYLRIIDEKRMNFSPTTHNDGQICVWEPLDSLAA